MLVLIGGAVGGRQGMLIAFFVALAMNFVSYWFSDKMVLAAYGAQPIEEAAAPRLYAIVHRLATRAGIPMPRVYLIPSETPNAFATGRNPEHAVVAVTEGIMRILDEEELEGVLAHELSHVKNRDVLISTVAATLAGAITYLAHMAQWAAMFGGRGRDDDEGGSNPIAMILLAVLAPIAALLVQIAVDDGRPQLVLFQPPHLRLGRGPPRDPGHRNVAPVRLHDLLGPGVVGKPLLGVARIAPGLELTVEGVVAPGLALPLRLLAVERVEVLVVRVRVVHEPADPDELVVVLPEAGAEDALLQDLQLRPHVEVLEKHGLHGLGERLGAEALLAHGQADPRPVATPLERPALELRHRGFRIQALDGAALPVVHRTGKARRDHGVGRNGEAVSHLHDVLPVDGVPHRPAHLHIVEGRLRHLRDQVPGAGERKPEHLLRGPGIVAQSLEIARLQRRDVELVVLIRQGAGLHRDDGDRHLVQRHVPGADEVLVPAQHHGPVVLPRLEHKGSVADDVGGLRPLVAVLLDRGPVSGKRREVRRQHREVSPRPLERHLERPVVLGVHADLGGLRHLALVEWLGALDVVEVAGVRVLARRIHLALPRPLEIARRARGAIRPPGVLADRKGPHRAVGVGRHVARHGGDWLEVHVELHQAGPERGHTGAVQVLVVVVAGGGVLPPASPADPYVLPAGQLLAGGELGRRRDGTRAEARRAHRRQPGRHSQEIAPPA